MIKKTLHIFVLLLFMLSTSVAYAVTPFQCQHNTNTTQMEMPCHQMMGDEQNNNLPAKKGGCGSDCMCHDLGLVKLWDSPKAIQKISNVTFIRYDAAPQNMFESAKLDTLIHPPKRS